MGAGISRSPPRLVSTFPSPLPWAWPRMLLVGRRSCSCVPLIAGTKEGFSSLPCPGCVRRAGPHPLWCFQADDEPGAASLGSLPASAFIVWMPHVVLSSLLLSQSDSEEDEPSKKKNPLQVNPCNEKHLAGTELGLALVQIGCFST